MIVPYTGPAAEAFVKDMSKLLSRASHSVEGMQTDTMREHVLGQLHECEGASSGSSDATQVAAASALAITSASTSLASTPASNRGWKRARDQSTLQAYFHR